MSLLDRTCTGMAQMFGRIGFSVSSQVETVRFFIFRPFRDRPRAKRLTFHFGLIFLFCPFSLEGQEVRPAEKWNALLAQSSGWLAADGIYSVAEPRGECVYFLFSDTICGTTKNSGREFDDVFMVNHTFGRFSSISGDADFYIPSRGQNLLSERIWLQDAFFHDGKLHFTAMCPESRTWKPARLDWVTLGFLADGTPDFQNAVIRKNVPLLADSPERAFVLGAAILEETDDAFLYVFGYADQKNEFSRKDLIAARVKPESLADFEKWRFWNGTEWGTELTECAFLVKGISPEFSISPIPAGPLAGKFLLVYTRGGISPFVEYRIGESPIGPFGPARELWRVPEHRDGVSAYNAKAHPALSTSEELIFTHNLNRLGQLPRTPSEYRPRFLRVRYADLYENETPKESR